MHKQIGIAVISTFLLGCIFCVMSYAMQSGDQDSKIKSLIDRGDFNEAEKLLKAQIADTSQPVTTEPAIQLEILRRTRSDYALTAKDILAEVQKSIPDATLDDVERWRKEGDLQFRIIDGEPFYFR